MGEQLYGGKAWDDLTAQEREAASGQHYVGDINDLPPDLREAAQQHRQAAVADVRAQEAAMSPAQLEFIRQQNEQHFNSDGSPKRLAAG